MIDHNNVVLTHHARQKMVARQVTFPEIVDIISNPDIREPHKGKTRYVKGELCVVVDDHDGQHVVVTILLRERQQWTDADLIARRAEPSERSSRTPSS